jgi:6-phosphogluconolactonase
MVFVTGDQIESKGKEQEMMEVFGSVEDLMETAANKIVNMSQKAVEDRGRFILALSGGNSPRPLFQLLARSPYREQLPWGRTVVLWSDERYVPLTDERSNARSAKSLLLDHVPIHANDILTVYENGLEPTEAAARYERRITELYNGESPRIDVTLLGCGVDGHTASLFPGSPLLEENAALVAAVPESVAGVARVTMTPLLLNQSRKILFIVYGSEKADIVHRVLDASSETSPFPAQRIVARDGPTRWLLDREAASRLTGARQV